MRSERIRRGPSPGVATPGGPVSNLPRARPHVAPRPEGERRPTWSVMIPTYNCARFLADTLASVLEQAPGAEDMQIEVVDDCSLDDPGSVVAAVGAGRVTFHRQARNVGHVRNFNVCIERARGELVHLLHGDDLVRPGFYERMGDALAGAPTAGAAVSRLVTVTEDGTMLETRPPLQPQPGVLRDWLVRIGSGQLIQPPSAVVRRAVYEQLGGYDERIAGYGEDWEMWVRIAAAYPVLYEPAALAAYRIRPGSLSAADRLHANMRDMRLVLRTNALTLAARLPPDEVASIDRVSRDALAGALLRRARRRGDPIGRALRTVVEAVRIHPSVEILIRSARLLARSGLRSTRCAVASVASDRLRARGRPR